MVTANQRELHDERSQIATKIRELADKQNDWTSEDEKQWAAVNADYDRVNDQLTASIEADRKAKGIEDRLEQIKRETDDRGFKPLSQTVPPNKASDAQTRLLRAADSGPCAGWDLERMKNCAVDAWFANQIDQSSVTETQAAAAQLVGMNLNSRYLDFQLGPNYKDIQRAFNSFNGGRQHAQQLDAIKNSLTTGATSGGDDLIGETYIARLEQELLAFGGMLQVADILRTPNGNPLRWPTASDVSNTGRQIGEEVPVVETDPSFSIFTLGSWKFSSDEILVSSELLNQSEVPLGTILPSMLSERLSRRLNLGMTTGAGTTTISGLITGASQGHTATGGALSFDDVIDLEAAVDPAYRTGPSVGYMCSDAIRTILRKLKASGTGEYLWSSGVQSGDGETLNMYPLTVNQNMATVQTAGAKPLVFGRFSNYKARMVNVVRMYRLTERHRENDQDAFLAFVEADGKLLDPSGGSNSPVQYLEMT